VQADSKDAEPGLYLAYEAMPLPAATIVVRSTAGPGTVATTLRSVVAALDPDLPLTSIVRLAEAANEELGVLAVLSAMFALFASVALGLATVGLYGLTSLGVTQRTRELGIRRALGASGRQVWWLVNRRVVTQLAIGLSLTLIHLVSIPVTNTSVNPARSTAQAIFVGGWALAQLWLFWIAPLVGGSLAGLVYNWLGSNTDEVKT